MDPNRFWVFRVGLKTGPYIHYESRDPPHANSGTVRNLVYPGTQPTKCQEKTGL
jgi:hypothetical protein